MVIHIKFEKKKNIILTNEDILKNMNYIDNLLKEENEIYIFEHIFYKNKNYFIILSMMIIIILIFIYYIKYFFK